MNKAFSLFFLILCLLSCSGGSSTNQDTANESPEEYEAGRKVYLSSCVACHQANGQGVEGAFPPLANSDYLLADKNRTIDIVAHGMDGEITVNGITYNAIMASQSLSKKEVKDVVNYILNAWGNDGGEVTMKEVHDVMSKK